MKKKVLATIIIFSLIITTAGCTKNETPVVDEENIQKQGNIDVEASATVDGATSASVLPDNLVQEYKPKGFTDGDAKKALFVVGDPRKYSVNYDLVNTAMKHFEDKGVEVELRDLYDIKFNPVLSLENFYYAKDGFGEPTPEIKKEQEFVTQADYIIFCYPNWHDTPTSIVKGYMETVFAKQFAYQDTDKGLKGMLKGKSIYTIMNAGFLGGGRGYLGDGVGINDEAWDEYMNAFRVMDDDTAGFWGLENKGRFVNDRTPKNNSDSYEEELTALREDLIKKLDKDFFN
ncbi:NAD(P)H-dependent oxidoreductase [Tissierella praeacuta]|uniref:NAD(P)H-dependent oxidoreductase n=1 Tax=Tissierella praeacuta TaxID=43131 RepID=UPI00334255C8